MPTNAPVATLFDSDRDWLSRQPRLVTDWKSGCAWLVGVLDEQIDQAKDVLPTPVAEDLQQRCRRRLWKAWAYHWQQANLAAETGEIDGLTVLEMLRRHVRPGKLGKAKMERLDGNPLQDVLLVEGVLAGHDNSSDQFHQHFDAVFAAERRRFAAAEITELAEGVWDRFNPALPENQDRLQRYHGFGTLRTFLRTLIRNRLIDEVRHQQSRRWADLVYTSQQPESAAAPAPALMRQESLAEFRHVLTLALQRLTVPEQQALFWRYHLGLSNQSLAQLLGSSEAQTSRHLSKALAKLKTDLQSFWPEAGDPTSVSFKLFAEALQAVLETTFTQFDLKEVNTQKEG